MVAVIETGNRGFSLKKMTTGIPNTVATMA